MICEEEEEALEEGKVNHGIFCRYDRSQSDTRGNRGRPQFSMPPDHFHRGPTPPPHGGYRNFIFLNY